MMEKRFNEESDPEQEMRDAFKVFDKDGRYINLSPYTSVRDRPKFEAAADDK